nr:ARID DNA-binding domain-containing protein [Tanacetum cinerariifolium]GEX43853.1 ARID DNA-binding domain-containing protein [Tanacetum cinerariifolium]
MENTMDDRWSRLKSNACGHSNMWHQSKSLRRPPRKKLHYGFIQRQLKKEKEARLRNCIRQITHDCKDMLRRKLEEIELYNSIISQNRNRKQKCYKCRQREHIIKNCPMKKKEHVEGTKKPGNIGETATLANKEIMTAKPTLSLNKLDDQTKFLFTYGVGEVMIKNGDEKYLIPGVYYAPKVTLNVLPVEQLERQGIKIIYENNTCILIYMFSNPKDHKLNEDKLRTMQMEYLEKYFESLDQRDTSNAGIKTVAMISMEDDMIEIKGTIYSTRVNTFNEYVAFRNLLKQDEIISQGWDVFRNKFDKVVKWFYEKYLERSLPGPIPPKINRVTIHLMDLYKIVESLG